MGKIWIGLCLAFVMQALNAQAQGIYPHLEYSKRIEATQSLSPLENGLFGENISLYNGGTDFKVVDIALPGNNALPVQLIRRIDIQVQPQSGLSSDIRLGSVGNWHVDVPYISATYPNTPVYPGWQNQRCTFGNEPDSMLGYFHRPEVWVSPSVHLPDRGNQILLYYFDGPSVFSWSTAQRDMFDCIPMKSGLSGEGFRMTTTEGLVYHFNVGTTRTASAIRKAVPKLLGGWINEVMPRVHYYLLASKVEDRFGNTVQFQYNANGYPTRIWSSDGREIVLSYIDGRLSSAMADGRIWQYQYHSTGDLAAVVLPDASQWQYQYAGTLLPRAGPSENPGQWAWCWHPDLPRSYSYTITATHPGGTQGLFTFLNKRHFRNGVHATECMETWENPLIPSYTLWTPDYYDMLTITTKQLSGPGMPATTWAYDYSEVGDGLWGTHTEPASYPCTTCTQYKTIVVTEPDGTEQHHRFGAVYRLNDGRLLQTQTVVPGTGVVRTEVTEYLSEADAPLQAFQDKYGNVPGGLSDEVVARVRPVVKKSVMQQGSTFTWQVPKTCSGTYCFDVFARPTSVTKSSTVP